MADNATDARGECRFIPFGRGGDVLVRIVDDFRDREQQANAARLSVHLRRARLVRWALAAVCVASVGALVLALIIDLRAWRGTFAVGLAMGVALLVAMVRRCRNLRQLLVDPDLTIGIPIPGNRVDLYASAASKLQVVIDNLEHIVTIPYPPTQTIIRDANRYLRQYTAAWHRVREAWVARDEKAWANRCDQAATICHEINDLYETTLSYMQAESSRDDPDSERWHGTWS